MAEEITRTCVDCGKDITVTVEDDGTYSGGNYFGEVEFPTEDAEIISEEEETLDFDDESFDVTVVEYDEYEEFEYWECDICYQDTPREFDDDLGETDGE